jgi:glyoxylase-like metal-dependent hydrolase (beta-lactamase superfamily II)
VLDGLELTIGGRTWSCRAGYGHAPEHIALYCAELGTLISGDMILPRISTNVSVHEFEPESNPLALYLDSIEKLRSLPEQSLVLPSHGRPFIGLHTRIDQLVEHHEGRLADVLTACRLRPHTAAELLFVLFKRQFELHETTFAMGEAVAHLNALWLGGQLSRTVDGLGVYRYTASAATA